MPRITITIPEDVAEVLRAVAAANHRSVSNLVASLLGDLKPMLSHVLQARTADELSSYLDGLLGQQEREARGVRAYLGETLGKRHDQLAAPPEGSTRRRRRPPASNTGVTE